MQPGLGQPQALLGALSFREPLLLMFSVIRDCLKTPFPISPCRARYPLRSRLYWGDSYSNLMDGDILLSVWRSLHCSLCCFYLSVWKKRISQREIQENI